MVGMAASTGKASVKTKKGTKASRKPSTYNAEQDRARRVKFVEEAGVIAEQVTMGHLNALTLVQQMHIAMGTLQPPGTEPVSIRRWRKLYAKNPDRFLAILDSREKAKSAGAAELERLQAIAADFEEFKVKSKADLTVALSRVAELEARLAESEDDEYADPAMERLEELELRLIRE
jgi:hypothetical protein